MADARYSFLQVRARGSGDAAALPKELTAQVRVGEEDRLFGSVTVQNIADLLTEKKYEIDRRAIQLEEPIRALGVYTIDVRLHADVTAKVKLWVVKE